MTEATYTAEQIEAIGGRRWSKADGTMRVYINQDIWAPMAGLDVDYYKTGNVKSAALNGEAISNSRAAQILRIKVYWEAGHIRIDGGVDFPEVAIAIRKAIAAAVAGLDKGDDDTTPDSPAAGTVAALRTAGRTVRQIAEMVGVSVSTIYRWARGICQPRPVNAAALTALA